MTSFEKKTKNNESEHDKFIEVVYGRCEKYMPTSKKVEKINDDDIVIPTSNNYELILHYNYNKDQLKKFLKHYKLRLSGSKKEVIVRIYCFLRLSYYATKIQKVLRGRIQRRYNFLHGPALTKREICTNKTDFFTMEDLNEISYSQFISYKDVDDFIYGFDIISLYNLIQKSGKDVKNPYNRMNIPKNVIVNMKTLLRLGKLLNIKIDIDIKDVLTEVTDKKSIELRILTLFQNIDSLGHYSNSIWFTSLNRINLIKFVRELGDIWNYRAQITNETKRAICPPIGDPFRNLSMNYIITEHDLENVRKSILDVLEKIVNSGVDRDSKSLGAYYVLGALTLVNSDAAIAIPWLFQSFSYF
uniref:SAP domain-containing protein n=1 Tax=viral metagenome TaxID=1070528 RepID=A0A6C0DRQ4_9ZZZZ